MAHTDVHCIHVHVPYLDIGAANTVENNIDD